MSENPTTPDPTPNGDGEGQEQSFTQSDVDRIVAERLKREREKVTAKYGDYDDLKVKAGEKATADERIAALEREVETTRREALRRRVQAAHGINDEDADLFLTGTDEESLTKQAQRLAARETERKNNGNHVPREGNNPQRASDPMREFARQVFERATTDN
jgi:hypothetical protein